MSAPDRPVRRPFDRVVVIFNPHSTGCAPHRAEQLRVEQTQRLPAALITMEKAPGPTRAVCAVMAAENANDHRRVTARQPLADA